MCLRFRVSALTLGQGLRGLRFRFFFGLGFRV